MKRSPTLLFTLGALLFGGVAKADGQSLLGNLETLAQDNARFYVAPLVTGLGSTLNSGFYQTASVHNMFGFDLGIRVMGARPPSEAGFFTPTLPGSITFNSQTFNQPYELMGGASTTPTAVGEGDGAQLQPRIGSPFRAALINAGVDPNDYLVQFPEGGDIPAVPFVVIQGSVGIGFGTEVTLRYLPSYNVHDDVGEVSAFGYGIKHSLTSWLPASPMFDVAVTAGVQDLQIGNYLDAKATNYGIIASINTGPLTLYGLGRREQSTIDIAYDTENLNGNPGLPGDGVRIAFQNEIPTQTRTAVGVTFRLIALEMSAEYSFAEYNTLAAKVGISIN